MGGALTFLSGALEGFTRRVGRQDHEKGGEHLPTLVTSGRGVQALASGAGTRGLESGAAPVAGAPPLPGDARGRASGLRPIKSMR